jgi:cell wall-associated NlpC family hydrolase
MTVLPIIAAMMVGSVSFGVVGLAALSGALPESQPMAVCAGSGPVRGLTDAQAQNARTIVAIASTRGGREAAMIAVMVAVTESSLLVLGNPNDPTGSALPNQGLGHDHDSLGLFQQRPTWGTAAQRMDPVASTGLFLDELLEIPGWQQADPWVVAQRVQRSAWTGSPSAANRGSGVVGGNYLANAAGSARIVEAVLVSSPSCGAGPGGGGSSALPGGYTLPANVSPTARVAVAFALGQLGKPYVWGATGPAAYDCSGLTSAAWRTAGVSLGRTTYDQVRDGHGTTLDRVVPGDLILTPGSDGSLAAPGHVGMYVGSGRVVEAPQSGDVVKVVSLTSYVAGGVAAVRHIA